MNIFDKIFKSGVKETIEGVGNVIDNLSTSNEEKSEAKLRLAELVTTQLNKITELQASVLLAEASGNWLQRSWRPIIMLSFGFIVVYSKFIAPAFNLPNTELEESFWTLLEVGMGGYVIGRSVEKITDTLTKNIDMPFIKKKNRDDKGN